MNNEISQMILIGSSGRNNGKTTVATQIISNFKTELPIIAMKIITITDSSTNCHRGVKGCGICSSLRQDFELVEETTINSGKDTSQLLKAGASSSFLLKTKKNCLESAWNDTFQRFPDDCLLIVESNSLRTIITPSLFLFCDNTDTIMKPSAKLVYNYADRIISKSEPFNMNRLSIQTNPIKIELTRELSQAF